jgi:UDP-N-acetylmuramate dehydrogenase
MPAYDSDDGVKLSAAWLIEQCGWRGARKGNVGVYDSNALVIVNHGGATGKEILAFAEEIQGDVGKRYGVELEPEVRIVGANTTYPPDPPPKGKGECGTHCDG